MKNLILIGMPGAGKSTVGVVLAKRLGLKFVDSDLVIQEKYGKLLHELIGEHGVDGFLALEDQVNAALKADGAVIATGGSAVYGEKAMRHFRRMGYVIYLQLPYEEIESRLGDLFERGVTMKPGQTLRELYEEREPLYRKYAHKVVDCSGRQVREIVLDIAELVEAEDALAARESKAEGSAAKIAMKQDKAAKTARGKADMHTETMLAKGEGVTKRKSAEPKKALKDKDIREPLFLFLEETYGKVRILEEKVVGRSRADVVMVVQDGVYGLEIKSDADTYTRLADQVKDYDQYFDANIVVVGTSHGEHVPEHVPPYWGIITVELVDGEYDFYVLRTPQPNPKRKWKKKLSLLWRPELAQLTEWNGMPKYKDLGRQKVSDKILERVPDRISEEELSRQVSELLFERDYSKVEETLAEYRKGEMEKQIDQETDPEKKAALMELLEQRQSFAREHLAPPKRRRRRRRS